MKKLYWGFLLLTVFSSDVYCMKQGRRYKLLSPADHKEAVAFLRGISTGQTPQDSANEGTFDNEEYPNLPESDHEMFIEPITSSGQTEPEPGSSAHESDAETERSDEDESERVSFNSAQDRQEKAEPAEQLPQHEFNPRENEVTLDPSIELRAQDRRPRQDGRSQSEQTLRQSSAPNPQDRLFDSAPFEFNSFDSAGGGPSDPSTELRTKDGQENWEELFEPSAEFVLSSPKHQDDHISEVDPAAPNKEIQRETPTRKQDPITAAMECYCELFDDSIEKKPDDIKSEQPQSAFPEPSSGEWVVFRSGLVPAQEYVPKPERKIPEDVRREESISEISPEPQAHQVTLEDDHSLDAHTEPIELSDDQNTHTEDDGNDAGNDVESQEGKKEGALDKKGCFDLTHLEQNLQRTLSLYMRLLKVSDRNSKKIKKPNILDLSKCNIRDLRAFIRNEFERNETYLKQGLPEFDCSLEELDLSNNELSFLPPQIGEVTSLKRLKLKGNKLAALPSTIGYLNALTILDVRKNKPLTLLPRSIAGLLYLTSLRVDWKRLTAFPEGLEESNKCLDKQTLKKIKQTRNRLKLTVKKDQQTTGKKK